MGNGESTEISDEERDIAFMKEEEAFKYTPEQIAIRNQAREHIQKGIELIQTIAKPLSDLVVEKSFRVDGIVNQGWDYVLQVFPLDSLLTTLRFTGNLNVHTGMHILTKIPLYELVDIETDIDQFPNLRFESAAAYASRVNKESRDEFQGEMDASGRCVPVQENLRSPTERRFYVTREFAEIESPIEIVVRGILNGSEVYKAINHPYFQELEIEASDKKRFK